MFVATCLQTRVEKSAYEMTGATADINDAAHIRKCLTNRRHIPRRRLGGPSPEILEHDRVVGEKVYAKPLPRLRREIAALVPQRPVAALGQRQERCPARFR